MSPRSIPSSPSSAQRDAALPDLRQIAMGELLQIHGQAAGVQDLGVPALGAAAVEDP